jgi:Galactose oxidase, central domain
MWHPLPAGPVDGRVAASLVWTGQELIVWGGEAGTELARKADGAACNPSRGAWRALAAAPIGPRSEHAAVWTGKEMIVWGGTGVPSEAVPDAAAYDPEQDRWRPIPNAPIGPTAFPVAVWTGTEMVVWGGSRSGGGAVGEGGAAYNPSRNRWRRIPTGPLRKRAGAASAWTGCEIVIWGGRSIEESGFLDDGATYDPATRRWRPLPSAPLGTERVPNPDRVGGLPPVLTTRGFIHPNALWTGDEFMVWGNLHAFRSGAPQAMPLAAYKPTARKWRALASPEIEFARQTEGTGGERAVWAGDAMVAWTGNVDARGLRALRFDVERGQWQELPPPSVVPSYAPDLVFTGTLVIAWQPGGSFALG